MNRIQKNLLVVKELGGKQLLAFAAYQFKLRTGILMRAAPPGGWKVLFTADIDPIQKIPFPALSRNDLLKFNLEPEKAIREADLVLDGFHRPFGGETAPLNFHLAEIPLAHWSAYGSIYAGSDIKFTWEPARFSWVYPLLNAYILTGDDKYAEGFWLRLDEFLINNPVNMGPNWASAQEVALRITPLLLALKTFAVSPTATTERKENLNRLLEQSGRRIVPTLDYARAQHNNHLLSEALGLIMLGTYFDGKHDLASKWRKTGFEEFEQGLLDQVDPDGTYSQHSTNYHRLMLQLALVYYVYAQFTHHQISSVIIERLAAATHWLRDLTDIPSGQMTNLGHQDGSLLLLFGTNSFRDSRPTLQAASLAFTGDAIFVKGEWDLLAVWLGISTGRDMRLESTSISHSPAVHRVGSVDCWGTLRAVHFHDRPAHADQLGVDLWFHGENIARDAGTFLYNDPPEWENALARTCVHNTVTINETDQMLRGGKFLWLNRINAELLTDEDGDRLTACVIWHTHPQIRHERSLVYLPGEGFRVIDQLTPLGSLTSPYTADLQWLLPDWDYEMLPKGILLLHGHHRVSIILHAESLDGNEVKTVFSLVRGGETIVGPLQNPIRGWYSPTYGVKEPGLSLVLRPVSAGPLILYSEWKMPHSPSKTG